jgi:hypothetical protein
VIFRGVGILQASSAELSFDVRIENRILRSDSFCSFRIVINQFQDLTKKEKEQILNGVSLNFPGFKASEKPRVDASGSITFQGKIIQAGFSPFEISLKVNGQTVSVKDYFLSLPENWAGAFDHFGYFIFMGRGDYWEETHKLAQWTLEDWKKFADWMSAHKVDTLYLFMTGWALAYPSQRYASLVDGLSQNAKYNFLKSFIDYAHSRGLKVHLGISADDLGLGFGKLYPETRRMNRYGDHAPNTAIGELGGLVLENSRVKKYILDLFDELLTLYPNVDGVVVMGYEIDPDRYNPETRELFRKETGTELTRVSKTEKYRWYNEKYLDLLLELYQLVVAKNPEREFVMFGFPWQEEFVQMYRDKLPEAVKICIPYYEWEDRSFHKWSLWPWVDAFGGERLVYMPTGVAWAYPLDERDQMERHIGTDRLVSTAEALGVKTCIFYAATNEGSEEDRTRDLLMTRLPITRLVSDKNKKMEIVEKLYKEYFASRTALVK